MDASPLDVEIATRTEAAVDAALTALRARPPTQCDRCGTRTFYPAPIADGWWRCQTCHGGTFRGHPTAAEEAEATRTARETTTAAVLAEGDARLRRMIAVDHRRDRRSMTPALARGMHEALLHRSDPTLYAATPAAREWLDHMSLIDLTRKHLELGGHEDPFTLSHGALARAALEHGVDGWMPTTRASGYLATSDVPALLDGVARTLFLDTYADTVRSFTDWTTAVTVADFRSTIVSSAEFPDLRLVPEHGEYVAGFPFGPAVPVRLMCFGRVLNFTRQAVLRNDLATFGQLQRALGVAAASVENDQVYELLRANPTLPDGFALFSSQHANLMPAKVLDATSLAAACAAVAANTHHGRPAFLLVGTANGATARQLVTQQTPPGATAASGALQVIQDDRITSGFYVTTDPREHPTLVTAHLASADGPELLAKDSWDIDARSYKGRDEFGAAVADWKGMAFTPAP